ncbi:hypothetical protein [Acidicapsa acidisoli]|uniref:hypothetical protein n=1 Tax=Acidicapsa acidisoli TaxID=1615681 RepID=UPI0021E0C6E1|nr:hypothetical protein [Acidicapsa acidisoli]
MASENGDLKESGWRINKRIDIATVGMLFLQTLAVVVWGVHLEDRVGVLERTSVTTEQFGRVDEKMNSLKDDTPDIRNALIDPDFYEHVQNDDLEGRVFISRDTEAVDTKRGYFMGYDVDQNQGWRVLEVLNIFSSEREPDFRKFIGDCYEATMNKPNRAFRSVLSREPIDL